MGTRNMVLAPMVDRGNAYEWHVMRLAEDKHDATLRVGYCRATVAWGDGVL